MFYGLLIRSYAGRQLTFGIVEGLLVKLRVTHEHVLLQATLVQVRFVAADTVKLIGYLPFETTGVGAAAVSLSMDLQVLLQV